jgi:MYND finger
MATTGEICSSCGSPSTMQCTRCKITKYCSARCQRSHWPTHKTVCVSRGGGGASAGGGGGASAGGGGGASAAGADEPAEVTATRNEMMRLRARVFDLDTRRTNASKMLYELERVITESGDGRRRASEIAQARAAIPVLRSRRGNLNDEYAVESGRLYQICENLRRLDADVVATGPRKTLRCEIPYDRVPGYAGSPQYVGYSIWKYRPGAPARHGSGLQNDSTTNTSTFSYLVDSLFPSPDGLVCFNFATRKPNYGMRSFCLPATGEAGAILVTLDGAPVAIRVLKNEEGEMCNAFEWTG